MARKKLALLLVCAWLTVVPPVIVDAFDCSAGPGESLCFTPPDNLPSNKTSVCPVPGYSVCRAQPTWSDQFQAATDDVAHIIQRYGVAINASSSACYENVVRYRCLAVLPPCQSLRDHGLLICEESCDLIRLTCQELSEEGIHEICSTSPLLTEATTLFKPPREPESECVNLDYDGPEFYLWIVGVSLALMFSLVGAISITLQKKSLMRNGPSVPVYKQPLWLLGFSLLLTGSIVDFVAYAFAPQSLLAPIAAVTLVWNMLVAPCFLKEKLDRFHVVATMIIFTGSVITVVFSNHSSPVYSLTDLMALYRRPAMAVYTVLLPGMAFGHAGMIVVLERYKLHLPPDEWLINQPSRYAGAFSMAHMIGYCGTAGIIGGQSVLFAKSTAEMIKSVVTGNTHVFNHLEAYIIISGMFLCLIMQITFLNGGLAHHNALIVVPVYQAYWIISGVMGGLIYFDEIKEMTDLQLGLFSFGILMSLSGVIMLALHSRFVKSEEDEYEDDDLPLDPMELEGDYSLSFDRPSRRGRHRNHVSEFAVESWLSMTPRRGAADVLVDMGLESKKVSRLLGTGKATTSRQRAKSRLIEMGIPQNIANRMLATKASLTQADEDAATAAAATAADNANESSRLTGVDETVRNGGGGAGTEGEQEEIEGKGEENKVLLT